MVGENLQALPGLEGLPTGMLAFIYLAIVAAIVYRGIRESMWVNVACTLVEAGGLLLVIAVGLRFWGSANLLEFPMGSETEAGLPLVLLVQGVVLTFYAFLGFEDSINIAEELKNPRRDLPFGLVMALVLTVVIYMSVAITAVSVVPWQELAEANAPAGRSHDARRALASGLGVHRYYYLRGRQYRVDQLRHRFAALIRHGPRQASAALSLPASIRCGARPTSPLG